MKVTVTKRPLGIAIVLPDRGVAVPLPAVFEVRDPALEGITVTGSLGADPDGLSVTVDELRLHREPGGPSLTAQHLRRVSIPQIEEAAIAELGVPWDASSNTIDESTFAALTASDVASLRGKRGEPTSPELLSEVARSIGTPHTRRRWRSSPISGGRAAPPRGVSVKPATRA